MKLLWRWGVIALVVACVASITIWLKNNDGGVQINWLGYQISAPFWLLISAMMVVLFTVAMAIWAVMRLKFWRKKSSLQHSLKNQQMGLSEVTKLISSLALGDVKDATKYLRNCKKLLGSDNGLYQLLDFYVAAKDGGDLPQNNLEKLEKLTQLENYSETKLLSYSAKANMALQQGELQTALTEAKKLYEMQGDNPRINQQYLGLLLQNAEFALAGIMLKKSRKSKVFTAKKLDKLQAIMFFMQFKQQQEQTSLLQQSFNSSPDFAPAYEWIIATNKTSARDDFSMKDAWKMLQIAWQANPHPELVEIILQYFSNEEPQKLQKQLQKMKDAHPNHIETQWLLANMAMVGKHYDVARNHLKAGLAISAQQRFYGMLVRLEEQTSDEKAAKIWLQKMANAKADPSWFCDNCGHNHSYWQLKCDNCHVFAEMEFGENNIHNSNNNMLKNQTYIGIM